MHGLTAGWRFALIVAVLSIILGVHMPFHDDQQQFRANVKHLAELLQDGVDPAVVISRSASMATVYKDILVPYHCIENDKTEWYSAYVHYDGAAVILNENTRDLDLLWSYRLALHSCQTSLLRGLDLTIANALINNFNVSSASRPKPSGTCFNPLQPEHMNMTLLLSLPRSAWNESTTAVALKSLDFHLTNGFDSLTKAIVYPVGNVHRQHRVPFATARVWTWVFHCVSLFPRILLVLPPYASLCILLVVILLCIKFVHSATLHPVPKRPRFIQLDLALCKKNVFISTAGSKSERWKATCVYGLLTSHDIPVWYDRVSLPADGRHNDWAISEGILNARCLLALGSVDYFKREWPQRELLTAYVYETPIINVFLAAKLPAGDWCYKPWLSTSGIFKGLAGIHYVPEFADTMVSILHRLGKEAAEKWQQEKLRTFCQDIVNLCRDQPLGEQPTETLLKDMTQALRAKRQISTNVNSSY